MSDQKYTPETNPDTPKETPVKDPGAGRQPVKSPVSESTGAGRQRNYTPQHEKPISSAPLDPTKPTSPSPAPKKDPAPNPSPEPKPKTRHVRVDRIAVVIVALVLIIALILGLCLYSCNRTEKEDDAATTHSETTSENTETDEAAQNADAAQSNDTETTEAESELSIGTTKTITLTSDETHSGDLMLINSNHIYTFPDEETDSLELVYEMRNSSYSVSDMEEMLTHDTIEALNAMMADYESETGYHNLRVFNCYRDKEDQDERFASGNSVAGGYSDYHSGRSFDISINFGDGTSDYYNAEKYSEYGWIAEHAAEYGFICRYPEGKESGTGEEARTYTYRYVGVPHATYMYENDLSLEEYLTLLRGYSAEKPLEIETGDGVYAVYTVTSGGNSVNVSVSDSVEISGDNDGGFVITELIS